VTKDDQEEKCQSVCGENEVFWEEKMSWIQHATNKFLYYVLADDGLIWIDSPTSALTILKKTELVVMPTKQNMPSLEILQLCCYI
jgi:hypothetical protein